MIDRLLGHDAWTTRRLLELSLPLDDDALDRRFPIGPGTLRQTLAHIVDNAACWTLLMTDADTIDPWSPDGVSIADLIERYDRTTAELIDLARRVADESRLDDTFVDRLDDPPRRKSYGAGILHVATHGMHHRAQALHMLRRLGVAGVPEGDAIGWEKQRVGGWRQA
ncbi:MAG: DinB family protein [Planctomycetota bacterium]